ncbi:hypothetical protein LVJ94_01725 [Pendulispora rubella]|uniref:DoxX family protein n=1 Tax=Pendulispora rubella TaxID=2741070 RepID=A0ABZ2L7R8_9BACT
MANIAHPRLHGEPVIRTHDPVYQAYQILHCGFAVLPVLAGVDKFLHLLVNWDQYLAPPIARVLGRGAGSFMLFVGAIEIAAGVIVAVWPKAGAYIVAGWLGAIIVNLLMTGQYFDIALRDFGLYLGALALGRLSTAYDRPVREPFTRKGYDR